MWCAMLEAYSKLKTKPKTIAEVKEALQVNWGNLPQQLINKAVGEKTTKNFRGLLFCCNLYRCRNRTPVL